MRSFELMQQMSAARLWWLPIYALAYAVGGYLGQWPTLAPGLTATLWIPSGLTLAVLLKSKREHWRVIAATGLAVDFALESLVYGFTPVAAALIAVGNIVEPLVGASLVLLQCKHPFRFRTLLDVFAFALLAGLLSPMIGATTGALMLSVTGVASFVPAWVLWWLGDSIGVIIVAPLVIAVIRFKRASLTTSPALLVEFVVLLLALVTVSHLWLSGRVPITFIILPFLVWAALRFGITGAALALATLAAMTFSYVSVGFEPFSGTGFSAYERTVIIQGFLGIASTSTLLLAALTEQRDEALKKLQDLAQNLEDRIITQTAALRESEERQRLALSAGRFGHWQLDFATMELSSSDQCKANFGRASHEPFTYDMFLSSIHLDDREMVIAAVKRAIREIGDYEADYRCIWPDGSLHWVNARGRAVAGKNGSAARMAGVTLEITERKLAEEEKRSSERRLRLFIEHAPAALAMFDREMRYLAVSHRWLMDYNLKNSELEGLSHYEVFPEIPDRWKAIHGRALNGEVLKAEDDAFHRADGTVQRLRWEVRPWHDAAGKVAGILVFSEDITARRQAEDAERESEARLRAIVETASDAIIVVNDKGIIQSINPHTQKVFGYDREELVEHNVKMLMPNEAASAHDTYMEAYTRTGVRKSIGIGREVEGRRKDGSTIPLDLAVAEWRDARGQRFFTGILRDVSERKLAAKTLAESDERLRLALDSAGAAEWSWDIVQDRLEWSERYRELYGLPLDEPPNLALWLSRVHPDDSGRLQSRVNAMLAAKGDDIWREEFRILHPKRGLLWLRGAGRLKRDRHGNAQYMTGINYDITQQRRAEHQLRLNLAAQSRLARLGALGELTAGIAHEINQPLMAAGTYIRLVAGILSTDTSEIGSAIITAHQAAEQIDRASSVIRGLRKLMRVGRVSMASVDALKLIDAAIDIVKPELEKAAISTHVTAEAGLPAVMADPLQLEQVLINLIRNSIEAISDAGSRSDGQIRIEVSRRANKRIAEFLIRDNGPGFASDMIDQPPQHFSTTKADGLGFGLPLSASIVKAHGGNLWIGENDPGGCIRFTLRIAEDS